MGKFWKFSEDKTELRRLDVGTILYLEHILDCFDFKYYDERCEHIESFIEVRKSGYYLVVRYWGNSSQQESVVKLDFLENRNHLLDKFISNNLSKIDLNYLDLKIFSEIDYRNKYLTLKELVD